MSLIINGAEMGVGQNILATNSGAMVTRSVYGIDSSMMVATRDAGYHSRPHRHLAEQLNFIVDGEIWVFVEGDAFLARRGDFYRIPPNAVHWGWNRSQHPVTAFQSYSPALDPFTRGNSVGLLESSESVRTFCETERLDAAQLAHYQRLEEAWLVQLPDPGAESAHRDIANER